VQIGLVQYALGRSEQAVTEWRAVLDREPERRDAAMYLRMLGASHPAGSAPADPGVSIRRDS